MINPLHPQTHEEVERDAARLLKAIELNPDGTINGSVEHATDAVLGFIAAAPRLIRGLLALLAASAREQDVEQVIDRIRVQLIRSKPSADNGNYSAAVLTVDEAETLLAHFAVPAREQGWRDIESAPKNRAVLVYMKGTAGLGIYRAILGDWDASWEDQERPVTRWRPIGYAALDDFPVGAEIIGWQPLPPPPRGSETP